MSDPSLWYLLEQGARTAAENMAVDDVLHEMAPSIERPILRLYQWSEPAASFGYSQKFKEIAGLTPLRPLVRRPTGGGLVPHDADWTYSLMFPPNAPWYSLKAAESYRRVHLWVQAAFERLQLTTSLAREPSRERPGQCFVGAETFDVLWRERKIAGAAQRRNRNGLLIQGSIQPPDGVQRAEWERAFCEVAREVWGILWEGMELMKPIEKRVEQRVREKFGNPAFIEGR